MDIKNMVKSSMQSELDKAAKIIAMIETEEALNWLYRNGYDDLGNSVNRLMGSKGQIMRILTQDIQKRYDEEPMIKELTHNFHEGHGNPWPERKCVSCIKRAIAQIDGNESIYDNHWMDTNDLWKEKEGNRNSLDLNILQRHLEDLCSLLQNRHQELSTWNEMLGTKLKALNGLLNNLFE